MSLTWLWGYLLPLGLLMVIWGGLPPRKARRVTPLAALTLALAILGYWAVGFALHMGGAHAVNPENVELAGLNRLFAPAGQGWGWFGLAGFFLAGDEITPTALGLFLAYLPLIATSVLVLVLALSEARRWLMVLAGLLAGAVIVPVAACWMWGSGWLFHLGATMGLGHGFVDFGGSALLLWLPATVGLGVLLLQGRREPAPPQQPPPAYFPLLANVGALLAGLGWMGWALAQPFHTFGATWDWHRAAVNILLGAAGSVLTSQLYAWLVTGEIEPLMSARGIVAGWGAILAGAPFVPPWAAVIIGLLAGILSPLVLYVAETYLHVRDTAAAITLGLVGGLWGTFAVALFADGRWGQGWNQIAPYTGSGEAPLGIAGIFTGGGEQLIAQVVGLLTLGGWGLLWGAILGFIARPSLPKLKLPAGMRATLEDLASSSEDEEETAVVEEEVAGVEVEEAPASIETEFEEADLPIESSPSPVLTATDTEEGES